MLSLAERSTHGYKMMLEARERADGRVNMGAGTLYGCLKRMVAWELIVETEHPGEDAGAHRDRPRYYELTRAGEEAVVAEIKLMQRYIRTARERSVLF